MVHWGMVLAALGAHPKAITYFPSALTGPGSLSDSVVPQGTQSIISLWLACFQKEESDAKFVVDVFSGEHKMNFESSLKT